MLYWCNHDSRKRSQHGHVCATRFLESRIMIVLCAIARLRCFFNSLFTAVEALFSVCCLILDILDCSSHRMYSVCITDRHLSSALLACTATICSGRSRQPSVSVACFWTKDSKLFSPSVFDHSTPHRVLPSALYLVSSEQALQA